MRAASAMSPGGVVSVRFMILRASSARRISLAWRVLRWIATRRSTGSSMSVASVANIAPTRFPISDFSSALRSDTGTWAMRGSGGSSPRRSR